MLRVNKKDSHLLGHKWFRDKRGYWMNPKHESIYVHRAVMGLKKGDRFVVDHINGDKSDNRRCNLRLADTSLNGANRKVNVTSKTGFKGVHLYARDQKFRATIRVKGKKIFLGSFETSKEAAKAYDVAAKKFFGEYALLNLGGNKK